MAQVPRSACVNLPHPCQFDTLCAVTCGSPKSHLPVIFHILWITRLTGTRITVIIHESTSVMTRIGRLDACRRQAGRPPKARAQGGATLSRMRAIFLTLLRPLRCKSSVTLTHATARSTRHNHAHSCACGHGARTTPQSRDQGVRCRADRCAPSSPNRRENV